MWLIEEAESRPREVGQPFSSPWQQGRGEAVNWENEIRRGPVENYGRPQSTGDKSEDFGIALHEFESSSKSHLLCDIGQVTSPFCSSFTQLEKSITMVRVSCED